MEISKKERLENFDKQHYVRPAAASGKLKLAQETGRNVFIRGASGYGKTSLVNSYFGQQRLHFYSAGRMETEDLEIIGDEECTVVIDDLDILCFSDIDDDIRQEIVRICGQEKVWLILISRGQIPGWLRKAHMRRPFLLIGEDDFSLTDSELLRLMETRDVLLTQEQLQLLRQSTVQNGMFLELLATRLSDGQPFSAFSLKEAQQDYVDYLISHVFGQWEPVWQDYMLKLSVVDRFDVALARMLTGRSDSEMILRKATEIGGFLEENWKEGPDGLTSEYVVSEWMKIALRRWVQFHFNDAQRNALYTNAGLYYEMNADYLHALEMYEAGGAMDRISALLINNTRQNAPSRSYYQLRRFYFILPEEEIKASPELMLGMSLLQSLMMNPGESERWYEELRRFTDMQAGSMKRHSRALLLYLDIALPHRGSADTLQLVKNAGVMFNEVKTVLPEFNITSGLPSIINGGKDFSEWTLRDREMMGSVNKMVSMVSGRYGKGLVDLAMAESQFEKGEDSYTIANLTSRGRMKAESGGKTELVFVADGISAWRALADGRAGHARDILVQTMAKAERDNCVEMIPNIRAMDIRLGLYAGEMEEALKWMKTAPNEKQEFFTYDRFLYLTKARIYMANGHYDDAQDIIERVNYYGEVMKRPMTAIECGLLLAILQYRCGLEEWDETLKRCLTEAEKYHFVRLITREGAAVAPLLEKTTWHPADMGFCKQIEEEVTRMSQYYPDYLKAEETPEFGENALMVLRMQAQGMALQDIAEALQVSLDTVKYHNRQTYRKLGVKNKTGAVAEAVRRGLI